MGGYIIHTDIDEIYEAGKMEGKTEGKIEEYISLQREAGCSDEKIKEGAMTRFQLGADEVEKYLAVEML